MGEGDIYFMDKSKSSDLTFSVVVVNKVPDGIDVRLFENWLLVSPGNPVAVCLNLG